MYQYENLLVSSQNAASFQDISDMFGINPKKSVIIAGPCTVENVQSLDCIASALYEKGIKFLRGGVYKPRTSPYDFQGLGKEGISILKKIKDKYNLITVTEVLDIQNVEYLSENVDILQIGTRNMQNYELLKAVGRINKPVLLKQGLSVTIQEFILAAEYIALQGNRRMILCERGIRTFETKTRNTLDITCIPILKKETCLPIIVDLSHSLGRKDIVNDVAEAALAVGADGIMIEVYPDSEHALSDKNQQLNMEEFGMLLKSIENIVN